MVLTTYDHGSADWQSPNRHCSFSPINQFVTYYVTNFPGGRELPFGFEECYSLKKSREKRGRCSQRIGSKNVEHCVCVWQFMEFLDRWTMLAYVEHPMILNALEAMHARRSIREFESELVPADVIKQLVEAAGRAPSSKNTQPWRLFLVQGAALESLRADYLAAFDSSRPGKPGYQYSPNPLPETWAARAKENGIGIFKHKGIGRDEMDKRRAHDRENFRFFGAQQVFFIGTQENAFSYGTFLDCGFVLDNLMIGLTALGYGSCPQFSAMAYPDLLKKHIPGSDDTLFIAGLPFGRPKATAHVNAYQTTRESIDKWFKVVE